MEHGPGADEFGVKQLARPVRTEESGHQAGLHVEGQPRDGNRVAISLYESSGFDHR
jgi:hypothetical protein